MQLYRPVGLIELQLLAASGFRGYPARFSWQPIFYPVLTIEYARSIIHAWNCREAEAGFCGFVTAFTIDDAFVARYPVRQLRGGATFRELWVPAEELAEFNQHLIGPIQVIESIDGPHYTGERDAATDLPVEIVALLRGD